MPFTALLDIKPFIGDNRYDAISQSGNFAKYEAAAAKKIRDMTGYAIPDNTDDAPDWVAPISAWLINYLALDLISGDSEAEVKRINDNYKFAFKEMEPYRKKPADGAETNENTNCGSFEEEDTW